MGGQCDRVVVGIDDSARSVLAVEWAAREAQAADLPLALVHGESDRYAAAVIDPGIVPAMELSARQNDTMKLVEDSVEVVRRIAPNLTVMTHVEAGSPVGVLCRQAESASMVVLGSEGSGLLSELVFGTVCGALAVRGRAPVVAVRDHPQPVAEDAPVAVGVDGTDISVAALDFAFRLAHRHHVRLRAVHVMPPAADRDPAEQERRRWNTADSLAEFATRYPHITIAVEFPTGDPVQVLAASAATAQLLVVGSRGRGVAAGLLSGSVSQALLRSVRGPIAVVRKNCRTAEKP
ncbi:MAG TPA: universal stress protein [Pseudonocardiaceae bacterium]|nr:universal stress protein [Pseudonocardiaceae bacterium]